MDPITLGAVGSIAAAGLSALGGVAQSALSNRSAKKNRAANEALAEKQFQRDKEMWNLNNQYNSPLAQVSRLKAAGLNPALAYGGSGSVVGNSDNVPNLDYGGAMSTPAHADLGLGVRSAFDFGATVSQVSLNKANAARADSETLKNLTLTPAEKRQMEQNILLQQAETSEVYQRMKESQSKIQLNMSQLQLNDKQTKALELANYITERSMYAQIASYSIKNDTELAHQREINKKLSVYDAKLIEIAAHCKQLIASAENLGTQSVNNRANKRNIEMEYYKIQEEIHNLSVKSDLTENEVATYAFDHLYKNPTTILGGALELLGPKHKQYNR